MYQKVYAKYEHLYTFKNGNSTTIKTLNLVNLSVFFFVILGDSKKDFWNVETLKYKRKQVIVLEKQHPEKFSTKLPNNALAISQGMKAKSKLEIYKLRGF